MAVALLLALSLCVVFGVGWLRLAGDMNRLSAEHENLRYEKQVTIVYGEDVLHMTPLERLHKCAELSRAAKADGFERVSRPSKVRNCGSVSAGAQEAD